jgi:tetratricopeptide (TPR) repeat protein
MISLEDVFAGKCDYIKIDQYPGASDVLIVFAHLGYPRGKFAMSRLLANARQTRVYVNCHQNSWFQSGLGPYTASVDETAALLKQILAVLNPSRTLCTGMSMGGYGAMLFGLLLECDYILAFTTEITIGAEYSRSYTVNGLKHYDERYRSLSDLVHRNRRTKIFQIYGAYDKIDLSLLWPIAFNIEQRQMLKLFMVAGDHQVPLKLDIPAIIFTILDTNSMTFSNVHATSCFHHRPASPEIYCYSAAHRFSGDGQQADLYRAIRNVPACLETSWMALYFANACFDLKKIPEGRAALLKCVQLDPNWYISRHALGLSYQATGHHEEAVTQYVASLALQPAASSSRLRMANALVQLGRTDEAAGHYEYIIINSPSITEAHDRLKSLRESSRLKSGSDLTRFPAQIDQAGRV